MPRRREILTTGEIYHLYNRAVGKERLFIAERDYVRFLSMIDFYRFTQRIRYSDFSDLSAIKKKDYEAINDRILLVDIYAFSLMPNHFHFLLKELFVGGIKKFISNMQLSFARYFNRKYNRQGVLFQGRFKTKLIQKTEQFIHSARYIHLNPVTACIVEVEELEKYPLTSHYDYVNVSKRPFINTHKLLKEFKTIERYKQFVTNQVDYQRKLSKIKHLLLD